MHLWSGFSSSVKMWLNASLVLTVYPSYGHNCVCLSSLRSGMPFVFFLSASWLFFPAPTHPRMEPRLPGVHLSGHLSKELAFPHSPQHCPEERVTMGISAWKAARSPELAPVSSRAGIHRWRCAVASYLQKPVLTSGSGTNASFSDTPALLFLLSRVCLQWYAEWFELFKSFSKSSEAPSPPPPTPESSLPFQAQPP